MVDVSNRRVYSGSSCQRGHRNRDLNANLDQYDIYDGIAMILKLAKLKDERIK